jgi:chaperonin cofactor prefoldin
MTNPILTPLPKGNQAVIITTTRLFTVVYLGYFTALDTFVRAVLALVATLQSQVATLQSQVATLQSQVATLNSEVTTLQSQVSTLQSQVSTLNSNVTTLQSQVSTLQSQVTTLQSQVSALQTATALTESYYLTTAYTVSTLPAAGTQGRRAWVVDARAPVTFNSALTGGSTVVTPVFDNGTVWVSA